MNWQMIAVMVLVAAAATYLLRSTWRTWRGTKATCGGGCGTSKACGATAQTPALIPVEQLRIRHRPNDQI